MEGQNNGGKLQRSGPNGLREITRRRTRIRIAPLGLFPPVVTGPRPMAWAGIGLPRCRGRGSAAHLPAGSTRFPPRPIEFPGLQAYRHAAVP